MLSVFDSEELKALERFGFQLGERGISKTASSVDESEIIDCGLGAWVNRDGKVFTKLASGELRELVDNESEAEQRYISRHMSK